MITAMQPVLRQLDEFPRRLREGLERGLEQAAEHLRASVAALAKQPFGVPARPPLGELAASVRSSVEVSGNDAAAHIFLAPPADRYGIFVETGSAPHFPPPGALEGWVQRRLGIGDAKQARQVAFLIGMKIARQGTEGRRIFEHALRASEEKVVAILDQAVKTALEGER